MSVYDDIVGALVTQISGVSNVGKVYGYQRFQPSYDKLINLFSSTVVGVNELRAFMVTLNPSNPIEGSLDGAADFADLQRIYNFKIIGAMGVQDVNNTEKTFIELCENIMNVLDGHKDFTLGSELLANGSGPCSMTVFEDRLFGTVMAHYAEFSFPVVTRYSITYVS